MSFRVVVEELTVSDLEPTKGVTCVLVRFTQTVDAIDLMRVIEAVNTPPKAKRVRRKAKAA